MNGPGPEKSALCLAANEPDLQMGRVYRILPDEASARDGDLRVIDDSGEDYLYPTDTSQLLRLNPPRIRLPD